MHVSLPRNGYHCPSTYNPADFLIGVLAKHDKCKINESAAQKLCDAFDETRKDRDVTITNFTMEEEDCVVIKKPFWLFTIFWLIHRNFLVVRRDPTIQKLRILQKMVSIACCLSDARRKRTEFDFYSTMSDILLPAFSYFRIRLTF